MPPDDRLLAQALHLAGAHHLDLPAAPREPDPPDPARGHHRQQLRQRGAEHAPQPVQRDGAGVLPSQDIEQRVQNAGHDDPDRDVDAEADGGQHAQALRRARPAVAADQRGQAAPEKGSIEEDEAPSYS